MCARGVRQKSPKIFLKKIQNKKKASFSDTDSIRLRNQKCGCFDLCACSVSADLYKKMLIIKMFLE